MSDTEVLDAEELKCLDVYQGGCTGDVEYRMPLSGTGKSFPRCDGHWAKRLEKQEDIVRRYDPFGNGAPPSDFDPADAGERWDDEY